MHPKIAEFSNNQIYNGLLINDISTHTQRELENDKLKKLFTKEGSPLIFIDAESKEEKSNDSYINEIEAKLVANLVCLFIKSGVFHNNMGVITFYSSQKYEIKEQLTKKHHRLKRIIQVDTVDAY